MENKKLEFWKKTRLGIIIAAIGLVMILAGIIVNAIFEPVGYKETRARIVDITHQDSKNRTEYHVYALYDADGKTYREELNYYTTAYNIGTELQVIYNPKNPSDVRVKGTVSYIYFLMAIGVMLMVIGAIFAVLGYQKGKTNQTSEEQK